MANQRCSKCGQPVEWITAADGRKIPLHTYGRCGDTAHAIDLSHISTPIRLDSVCCPTTCPKCHGSVFFVRHNCGSVWLDELGDPWPKHECMYTGDYSESHIHPPTPSVFPESKTEGKVLGIEVHDGTYVIFVKWTDCGISMYQCPKQGKLHVNFKLFYDPMDDGRCFRTKSRKTIPLDSKITKRHTPPSLAELQSMIEYAHISGKQYAKITKRKRRP